MKLRLDGKWYKPDKGKHFVLTEKGKQECASWNNKTVGKPVDKYDTEIYNWAVEKGFVEEVDIPGWTKLIGYEIVYYNYNGDRLHAGSPIIFPVRKAAENYKKHYESLRWFNHELYVEEKEYEGVPLNESRMYDGKEVIDEEHYFGLDACAIGDYFTEEMVNDFMDLLPPVCMRRDCSQIGEPVTTRIDENGNGIKYTYNTFKKIADGIWEYCGDCFEGENVKRGTEIPYVL